MNNFIKGATIIRSGTPHRVLKLQGDRVQLENVVTGEVSSPTISELHDEYVLASLLVEDPSKPTNPNLVGRREFDPETVLADHKKALAETRRRIAFVDRILSHDGFGRGLKQLKAALAQAAEELKEKAPHTATIYRWYKNYCAARHDARALLSNLSLRGGRGQSRLASPLEGIVSEQIDKIFLAGHAGSAEDVQIGVVDALEKYNQANNTGLKPPSLRTIQRRLAEVAAFDLAEARQSLRQANRDFAFVGKSRGVKRILEIVEIDHTPLDILVINAEGVVIGRPTLTVVLDRMSRCILGAVVSLSGHGTDIVLAALRHALLPKTYIGTRFPNMQLEWPCFGWPLRVVMDNGLEFHAQAVADALLTLGIISEFAKSKSPNDKPFVERFIKTLNYSLIHKLPGTTLAKHHLRKGFKSEDEACLTLDELDEIIHVWICQKYHHRPHKGLHGRSPLDVWKQDAALHPPQLKANVQTVDVEFGQVKEASLQHYGIDLNNFIYQSPKLAALRAALPGKRRVLMKWSRMDVGCVHVWDPLDNEYLRVPNQDPQFNGLSLEQAKAVRRKRAGNGDPLNQYAVTAKAVIDEIVLDGLSKKKLKDRRRASKLSGARSKHAAPQAETVEQSDLHTTEQRAAIAVPAFEVEVE